MTVPEGYIRMHTPSGRLLHLIREEEGRDDRRDSVRRPLCGRVPSWHKFIIAERDSSWDPARTCTMPLCAACVRMTA